MEDLLVLNQRLVDHFGRFEDGQANWRVVWSEDQLENRLGTYDDVTSSGVFIRQITEVRRVPKYRQWIHAKFVLERITGIPEMIRDELQTKISYEPIYVFEDGKGNALPPNWVATKFIIDNIYDMMDNPSGAPKYKDPESDAKESLEMKEQRLKELQDSLFGDESDVGDALAHNEAIVVPSNYEEKK